jgi:HK97 family phage major capsid protein
MAEELLKRLHEQRMVAVKAAREIAERLSTADDVTPNAEDEAAYQKANEDISRFGELAQDERKRLDAEHENEEAFADAEKRAGFKGGNTSDDEPEHRKDWQDLAREAIKEGRATVGGSYEQLPTAARLREIRALTDPFQKTSATHGQETVPTTLVESLFIKFFADSAILRAGPTILRTASGEALKFPRLTGLGNLTQANARVAELGQIQKGNATFDQVQLDAYKYGQISQSSREVIEDSVIDVRGLMGTVLGRNMANYLGYDLTLGAGTTGIPRGVVTVANASGQTVTGATGKVGAPSNMDDILTLIGKLPVPYRVGAKFLMNDTTTFILRKFKLNFSTGENAYAWQPSLVPGGPDSLMGYPIVIDPNVAGTGLGATSIVFGDFSLYYVRLVNDVRVEYSTEYAWDTDLVSVKAVLRADGDAIDDTGFAAFIGGAS